MQRQAVTGLDLVEIMIRVAEGYSLEVSSLYSYG
jgi:acetyl/propionyl-CoA carboxylase alpha subunit